MQFLFHSHLKQNAKNWVSSEEPLDTAIPNMGRECPKVSAGEQIAPFANKLKRQINDRHGIDIESPQSSILTRFEPTFDF